MTAEYRNSSTQKITIFPWLRPHQKPHSFSTRLYAVKHKHYWRNCYCLLRSICWLLDPVTKSWRGQFKPRIVTTWIAEISNWRPEVAGKLGFDRWMQWVNSDPVLKFAAVHFKCKKYIAPISKVKANFCPGLLRTWRRKRWTITCRLGINLQLAECWIQSLREPTTRHCFRSAWHSPGWRTAITRSCLLKTAY